MTRKTTGTMRTRKRKSRPMALRVLGRAVVLGSALTFFVWSAHAVVGSPGVGSATKVPKPRTVDGVVRDGSGAPVQGAVVYLQDSKSLAVRSYLSDEAGRFHFRQLSLNNDYALWAEVHGKRSKIRNISQFNSRPDLHFTLEVKTAK
jgi:hypothetical protein